MHDIEKSLLSNLKKTVTKLFENNLDKTAISLTQNISSTVTPAYAEPLPGWVDNLNGPVGIMIAAAKGVLRTLLCNGELSGECIPVDFAINGLIGIARKVAMTKEK